MRFGMTPVQRLTLAGVAGQHRRRGRPALKKAIPSVTGHEARPSAAIHEAEFMERRGYGTVDRQLQRGLGVSILRPGCGGLAPVIVVRHTG